MAESASRLRLPEVIAGEIDGVSTLYLPTETPIYDAMLAFRVGRADEQLASGGITHLAEHLAFAPFASPSIRSNGWVGDSTTAFAVRGSDDQARRFLGDICTALSALPVDRLDHEKRVITTEEASQGRFPPWTVLPFRLGAVSWGTLGYDQFGLDRVDADDVLAWAAHWFCQENAVLCYAGPEPLEFDVTALPRGARRPLPVARPVSGLVLPTFAQASGRHIVVSMETDGRLGSGMALRVLRTAAEQHVRHSQGLSYAVQMHATELADDQTLAFLWADALPEHAAEVSTGIWSVLSRLADHGPMQAELWQEFEGMRAAFDDPQAVTGLMTALADSTLTGTSVEQTLARYEDMLDLDAATVQGHLERFRASALITGPPGSAPEEADLHPYPHLSTLPPAARTLAARSLDVAGDLRIYDDGVAVSFGGDEGIAVPFDGCEAVLRWRNGDLVVINSEADRIWLLDRHYDGLDLVRDALMQAVSADRFVDLAQDECLSDPPWSTPLRRSSLRKRAAAAALDAVTAVAIFLLVIVAVSQATKAFLGWDTDGSDEGAMTGLAYAVWAIACWAVFAIFLARTGATPGKRRCGLAVVTRDGRSLSPLRAAARVAVTIVGICLAGIGLLMIPFSRSQRGLADFVTGTEVVAGAVASRTRER